MKPALHIDTPIAGLYRVRLERGGRWMPVAITGDGNDWRASAGNDPVPLEKVWPWCARNPIDAAEYEEMMDRLRLGIGGNAPPPEEQTLLDQADDLAASAEWLASTQAKIDAVKRATGIINKLDAERKAAVKPLKEEIADIERPYKDREATLENTKAALTADLEPLIPAEGMHGDYAKAYWRETQTVEITDATKLPRELMQPNVKQVEAYLKAGGKLDGARLKDGRTLVVS